MVVVYSVDLEFPGPCPQAHGTVALGAVAYDTATDEVLSQFFTHVKMADTQTWDEEDTVPNFWKTEAGPFYQVVLDAQPEAPSRATAGVAFVTWLRTTAKTLAARGKHALLFDTAGSDFSQLEALLPRGIALKMIFGKHVPTICSTSFFLGVARVSPDVTLNKKPAETLVLNALGLERPVFPRLHDHNPVHDADHNARFFGFIVRALAERDAAAASAQKRKTDNT